MSADGPREEAVPAPSRGPESPTELEAARREVARLERANAELRRVNRELARSRGARTDSAAASAIHRATKAERTMLRAEGWKDWPLPLRIAVSVALLLRKLAVRIRG